VAAHRAFTGLYDYRTGKRDWMSAGCLPRGTNFQVARVHLLGVETPALDRQLSRDRFIS
jgi:hypothetical protein